MIEYRYLLAIANKIVSLYNPDYIYLFGSYAKGKATECSDLDFIVVRRTNLPKHMRGVDVVSALAQFAVDIDVLFLTPEELELECNKPCSFLKTVMPSARLLYKRLPKSMFYCNEIFPL